MAGAFAFGFSSRAGRGPGAGFDPSERGVALGSLLDRFGARAMTHLAADRRHAYLETWAASEDAIPAQLWMATKTLFGMTYLERPEVVEAIGLIPFCRTL